MKTLYSVRLLIFIISITLMLQTGCSAEEPADIVTIDYEMPG